MIFTVADLVVSAENMHPDLTRHFNDYLTTNAIPELTVTLKETAPIPQSVELLREVNYKLMEKDTFLMHCSALSYNRNAILITAHSGTGKSTHARMWREVFGDKIVMINDDKPFLRFENEQLYALGSPWDGKHHLSTNAKAPVKAICFLSRGEEDSIKPLAPREALSFIFDQVPRNANSEYMTKLLYLLDKMLKTVPLYSLVCTPTHNAAKIAAQGMIGDLL